MASVFENALTEAKAYAASKNVPRAEGTYVVEASSPYFCRSTDAFAGMVRFLSEAFPSLEEAEARLDALEEEYVDCECSFELINPFAVKPVVPVAEVEDDGCPF